MPAARSSACTQVLPKLCVAVTSSLHHSVPAQFPAGTPKPGKVLLSSFTQENSETTRKVKQYIKAPAVWLSALKFGPVILSLDTGR